VQSPNSNRSPVRNTIQRSAAQDAHDFNILNWTSQVFPLEDTNFGGRRHPSSLTGPPAGVKVRQNVLRSSKARHHLADLPSVRNRGKTCSQALTPLLSPVAIFDSWR